MGTESLFRKKSVFLSLLVIAIFTLSVPFTVSASAQSSEMKVQKSPWGVALDTSSGLLYVDNDGGKISVINTTSNTVTKTISVRGGLAEIAYDSINNMLYAANNTGHNVVVIRGLKMVASITVGSSPMGVAVDSSINEIFVTNQGSDSVSVIDGKNNSVIHTIKLPVGSLPWSLAEDPNNDLVYVANAAGGNVYMISVATDKLTGSPIPVGTDPWGVAVAYDNDEVFVSNFGSASVTAISDSSNTVAATIPVGNNPYLMVYVPTVVMYVAEAGNSQGQDNISSICAAANIVLGSIGGGDGPYGLAYDSMNGYLYAADHNAAPFALSALRGFVTADII